MPLPIFRRCVSKYQGDFKVKTFSCFDQFLCMAFAQITHRESLRDIEICLRSQNKKLYHMGIRGRVSRSTLAEANEKRDWRIYAEFAQSLIGTARELYREDSFLEELNETVYALDATTIDLCLSVFPMGTFPKEQSRRQTPYTAGSKGQHPYIHPYFRWQVARCQRSRSFATGSRCILRYGSRLCGLRKALYLQPDSCIFRHPGQIEHAIPKALFTSSRQGNRASMRPNNHSYRVLYKQALPRHSSSSEIQGCQYRQDPRVSHQQFYFASTNDSPAVSQSLAGRAVLQMDQAAPENKEILWYFRECRKDSGLDSSLCLCPRSDNEKASQPLRKVSTQFYKF